MNLEKKKKREYKYANTAYVLFVWLFRFHSNK